MRAPIFSLVSDHGLQERHENNSNLTQDFICIIILVCCTSGCGHCESTIADNKHSVHD